MVRKLSTEHSFLPYASNQASKVVTNKFPHEDDLVSKKTTDPKTKEQPAAKASPVKTDLKQSQLNFHSPSAKGLIDEPPRGSFALSVKPAGSQVIPEARPSIPEGSSNQSEAVITSDEDESHSKRFQEDP